VTPARRCYPPLRPQHFADAECAPR
jgi:hypothetical protein